MEGTEIKTTTNLEFEVKVKLASKETCGLVDVLESNAKLTKADAGREADIIEDWIDITIDPSEKIGELPKIEMKSHSKLTKADSGRVSTK
jgi:hypothetical protein